MMNKIGNCILNVIADDVDYFYFNKREGLVIQYNKPKNNIDIINFINGQSFLYNFINNEFRNDFEKKNIYELFVNFTDNKITLQKQPVKFLKYKLDRNNLNEQLHKIINDCEEQKDI